MELGLLKKTIANFKKQLNKRNTPFYLSNKEAIDNAKNLVVGSHSIDMIESKKIMIHTTEKRKLGIVDFLVIIIFVIIVVAIFAFSLKPDLFF